MESLDNEALDPSLFYRHMRESQPVYYHPEEKRWMVFRYKEAEHVLSNSTLFASGKGLPPGSPKPTNRDPLADSLLTMNPPDHREFRTLVTQAFTPRTVAQLSEKITHIVTHLLDEVAGAGTMDVYEHLASPLPTLVIAELLGIPREDRTLFTTWSEIISHGGKAPDEMKDYFLQVLKERRKMPQDDLMSVLVDAQVYERALNQQELLGFCVLFLAAAIQPTRNLIAAIFLSLVTYPNLLAELHREPDLIPGTIEEVLRYYSPFHYVSRIALVDTMLGGQQIQARQRLIVYLASANRDDAQFPDPDRFDIRRTPNHHLTFGHGIHFCIGAPLARLQTKIMLSLLQARFQDIRSIPQVPGKLMQKTLADDIMHLSMPITFQQMST